MSFPERRIHFLDAAREQLSEILLYTEREWGEEQRDLYFGRLMETLDLLASRPEIGRRRDDLSQGLRSYPTGSHTIYYWHRGDTIMIARILHRRQNPAQEAW